MLSVLLVTGRSACSDLWLEKLRKENKIHPVKELLDMSLPPSSGQSVWCDVRIHHDEQQKTCDSEH